MLNLKRAVITLLLLSVSSCSTSIHNKSSLYDVERVIDGDTIVLKGRDNPIRLACINTPEIAKPGQSLDTAEEGAYEAKEALERMLATSGNQVYLESFNYLSYNREVGFIRHSDDPTINLGLELVKQGHAELQSWHRGCNDVNIND